MRHLTAEFRERTQQSAKLDADRKSGADPQDADTFHHDLHKDLKADYVLANPPFNDSDWHRGDEGVRWKYGLPPKGNANFAWEQLFIHHLSPKLEPLKQC